MYISNSIVRLTWLVKTFVPNGTLGRVIFHVSHPYSSIQLSPASCTARSSSLCGYRLPSTFPSSCVNVLLSLSGLYLVLSVPPSFDTVKPRYTNFSASSMSSPFSVTGSLFLFLILTALHFWVLHFSRWPPPPLSFSASCSLHISQMQVNGSDCVAIQAFLTSSALFQPLHAVGLFVLFWMCSLPVYH